MKTALRPDYFFKNIPTLVKDKEAESKGATDEERFLFALSETKGWTVLSEFIKRLSSDLDQVNKLAISQGAPLEEIGKNTIVVSLAQDVIGKILDKVEDAVEACHGEQQPE